MVDVKENHPKEAKDPKDPVPIIKVGDVVEEKYEVRKTLGQGAFGAVFEVQARRTKELYALKMELDAPKQDEPGLSLEVSVLKRIQHSVHAVRYIDSGSIGKLSFLVMQLVGCNLSELRKSCPEHHFTLCTALRLSLQCLEAMEAMHNSGLLHRDIKPSNFALGRSAKDIRNVYILDFGLVRRYRLKNGQIRPPRYYCGFRGTAKYASLSIHAGNEWGRVDDCWCWLYLLVEFQKGGLPWRWETERHNIAELKVKYKKKLFRNLEPENLRIQNNLDTLKYADDPPYAWYRQQLIQIMDRKSMRFEEPYDWESEGEYYKYLKKICPQPYEYQMKDSKKTIKEKTEGEDTNADCSISDKNK